MKQDYGARKFLPPFESKVMATMQRGESFAAFKERIIATLRRRGVLKPGGNTEARLADQLPPDETDSDSRPT